MVNILGRYVGAEVLKHWNTSSKILVNKGDEKQVCWSSSDKLQAWHCTEDKASVTLVLAFAPHGKALCRMKLALPSHRMKFQAWDYPENRHRNSLLTYQTSGKTVDQTSWLPWQCSQSRECAGLFLQLTSGTHDTSDWPARGSARQQPHGILSSSAP